MKFVPVKKLTVLVLITFVLNFSSPGYAVHGYVSYSNTLQFCTFFCDVIPSLETGSSIDFVGQQVTVGDEAISELQSFSITLTSPTASLLLSSVDVPVLSSTVYTVPDEFETTIFTGGRVAFDTSSSFAALFGVPSKLVINFDTDQAKLVVANQLAASTSAVPVPAAAWLFGFGLIMLSGFARRRSS